MQHRKGTHFLLVAVLLATLALLFGDVRPAAAERRVCPDMACNGATSCSYFETAKCTVYGSAGGGTACWVNQCEPE
jgi:hypothetical protein